MSLTSKVFGSYSNKTLKKFKPVVAEIEKLKAEYQTYSDEKLQQQTQRFRDLLANGQSLDDLLPEAFAVVREASRRVLGIEHYPVQLLGGMVLYHGGIAEMKTGEGKTAVATLAAYLKALEGKGVHVVTVNDYLAKRDADEMGQVHRFLGLTVGCVLADMSPDARREAYACDITYITNNELGFDYLRDNMSQDLSQCVQRSLHYAIIDEVDSILIDEARTPLIISGKAENDIGAYQSACSFVKTLVKGTTNENMSKMELLSGQEVVETGDFVLDEKEKTVHLTEEGVKKAESYFHVDNLANPEHAELQHQILMALKARNFMHKDKDYVVKDGEILIVDEFTGRIMNGRRYSDGLHQAIEAKEGVEIKGENKTLATITLQNFFNKYESKAGMTGTAMTEEQEFDEIYHMKVVSIPTNRPVIRQDLDDKVYTTKEGKYKAIVQAVKEIHARKQPILVGTVSIEVSEILSEMLRKEGIKHQVLNAKYHEMEAEIVSHAGEAGMVTIATNMAGRGTDIKLDEEAKQNGGLYIIGTERHESRRIDNQLRGRSGRQGDPGVSQFYISLEDDVLRLFMPENMLQMFQKSFTEDTVIVHKRLTKSILKAQKRIEGNHFQVRKNLTDFDAVNNEQRELIYADRRRALEGDDISDSIHNMMAVILQYMVQKSCGGKKDAWNVETLKADWCTIFPNMFDTDIVESSASTEEVFGRLHALACSLYAKKTFEINQIEDGMMGNIERAMLLRSIDHYWQSHMNMLDQLRQNVSLIGYGQKDPVIEYRAEAYEAFDEMLKLIRQETLYLLLHTQIVCRDAKE